MDFFHAIENVHTFGPSVDLQCNLNAYHSVMLFHVYVLCVYQNKTKQEQLKQQQMTRISMTGTKGAGEKGMDNIRLFYILTMFWVNDTTVNS